MDGPGHAYFKVAKACRGLLCPLKIFQYSTVARLFFVHFRRQICERAIGHIPLQRLGRGCPLLGSARARPSRSAAKGRLASLFVSLGRLPSRSLSFAPLQIARSRQFSFVTRAHQFIGRSLKITYAYNPSTHFETGLLLNSTPQLNLTPSKQLSR